MEPDPSPLTPSSPPGALPHQPLFRCVLPHGRAEPRLHTHAHTCAVCVCMCACTHICAHTLALDSGGREWLGNCPSLHESWQRAGSAHALEQVAKAGLALGGKGVGTYTCQASFSSGARAPRTAVRRPGVPCLGGGGPLRKVGENRWVPTMSCSAHREQKATLFGLQVSRSLGEGPWACQ